MPMLIILIGVVTLPYAWVLWTETQETHGRDGEREKDERESS